MQLRFFMTLELRYILVRSNYAWKSVTVTFRFYSSLSRIFYQVTIRLFICIYVFYDIRIRLCFGTFELRMEITFYNYLSFLFVIVTYFSLRHNQVIYLFDVVTFFNDVRITLCFGTFELRAEITLQLCLVFVHHCDVFFITSQLRFLFVWCS